MLDEVPARVPPCMPVAIIEATSTEILENSRFDQPDRSEEKAWPHPVVANSNLYLRDQDMLFSCDVKKRQSSQIKHVMFSENCQVQYILLL